MPFSHINMNNIRRNFMTESVITCSRLGDLSSSVLTGILNLGSVLLALTFEGRLVGVSEVDIRGWRDNTDSKEEARARGGDRIMVDLCARSPCPNTLIWALSSLLVDEVVVTTTVGAVVREGVLGWVSLGEAHFLMRLPVRSFVRHFLFFPDTGVWTMGVLFFVCLFGTSLTYQSKWSKKIQKRVFWKI